MLQFVAGHRYDVSMIKTSITYSGQKHCELTHAPSGSRIETDAPRDNDGKGERFSPTDLVGAALGSCILTTMAIVGERDGLSIANARAEVEKEMVSGPRRIGTLRVKISLPRNLTPEQRIKLETIARSCPVQKSLHPDVQVSINFEYS